METISSRFSQWVSRLEMGCIGILLKEIERRDENLEIRKAK
jgi:hypothetical protein